MISRIRWLLSALFLAGALLVPAVQTSAQGNPEYGERPPESEIPGAEQCTVEPRTVEEFNALIPEATPEPDPAQLPHHMVEELPTGQSASDEDIAVMSETVNIGIGCWNAGDGLAYLATFSDAWIAESTATEPLPSELDDAVATPEPEEHRIWLIAVTDAVALDDGRIGAAVTIGGLRDDHPGPGRTFFMVFVEEASMWRIDEQIERVISDDDFTYVADHVAPIEGATPETSP